MDLQSYAANYNIPITYNSDVNRLLVNNTPANMENLTVGQDGKIYGDEQAYKNILTPFLNQNILSATSYQTPDYIKDFMKQMLTRQSQPFSYDASNDPLVAASRQQLEQSIAEMAGSRGFLYGQARQGIVGQVMQQMLPQFEDRAYQREQDYLNRQMQMANVIMQWDNIQADRSKDQTALLQTKADFIMQLSQRNLDIFKTMLDQRRFDMEYQLNQQRFDMEKKQQELNLAYKKLETLSYADNEVSTLLGIPVGTRATWVQQMLAEEKASLAKMKAQHDYDVKMLSVNAKIEKELTEAREKVSLESKLFMMQQEYSYREALMEQDVKHKREIEAIEAERAAKQAAANAAAKEAKAKESTANKIKNEQLDIEYKWANTYIKNKFAIKGLIEGKYRKIASKWLYEQLKAGDISNAVYNKIIAEYRLTEYNPGLSDTILELTKSKNEPFMPYKIFNSLTGGDYRGKLGGGL